jgi:hypothetical protein
MAMNWRASLRQLGLPSFKLRPLQILNAATPSKQSALRR